MKISLRTMTIAITVFVTNLLVVQPSFGADQKSLLSSTQKSLPTFRVEKVLRADTIRLENGERIRLIGLKAPEPPPRKDVEHDQYGFIIKENNPTMSIEERAMEFTRSLLEGKMIRIEFDSQKKDDDFYTVAYVFLASDNTFVNAEILRQGYASLHLSPPNLKYEETLRAAYREARENRRGLSEDY